MKRVLTSLVIGLTVTAAGADDATDSAVSRLSLRTETIVSAHPVRMADVLVMTGADPQLVQQIGDAPVVPKPDTTPIGSISHEQVVKRLDELGVNLARVLVSGALQCRITRPSEPAATEGTNDEAALLRTPSPGGGDGPQTLASVLHAHVRKELAELGGTPEIAFERAGQEFLQLTTPPWDFTVSSTSRDKLGLREFRVIIRRDGQTQRKAEVFAEVRLVQPVVVALRPLSIGTFVRPADVGLETRVFEQGMNLGIRQLEIVVGQQVKRFIPAGDLVQADALKPVDMVVRSRPVTVTGMEGPVQLRLTGVALDSGGYGETVRVRLGDARRDKQVLRGVVTGLGAVRLSDSVQ